MRLSVRHFKIFIWFLCRCGISEPFVHDLQLYYLQYHLEIVMLRRSCGQYMRMLSLIITPLVK